MVDLRRPLTFLVVLGAAGGLVIATPATASASHAAASARPAAVTTPAAVTAVTPVTGVVAGGIPCRHVVRIGAKKVVADKGMSAFTVRQFRGWCTDAQGSAWMNFSAVYVWYQYHVRGFDYRVYSGINVVDELDSRGFAASDNRQRLSYSTPVRTIELCTRGWAKLDRSQGESGQGLTTVLC